MKKNTTGTAVAATVLAAGLAAPAGGAFAAGHVAASKTPTPTPTTSTKTQKFKGTFEDNRWGGVQVTIYVKKGKITNVKAAIDPHTNRSVFIDENAIPQLHDEVLQAQNATIDEVSGATDTSDSFIVSLQNAIKSAKKHKALK